VKIIFKVCLLFSFAIVLFSCTDDSVDLKKSIQPSQDEITVATDTLHLQANYSLVASVPAKVNTDTFLLGSYTDVLYGTTKAEMLAQFNCPTGWTVPSSISSDTLTLTLTYTGYQAKGDSTVKIKIYKMNNTLNYSGSYASNIDPSQYASTELVGSISCKPSSSSQSGTITITLDTVLKNQLIDAARNNNQYYSNETLFTTKVLNGLYISVDGASTAMLTLSQLNMNLSYNYKNSGGTTLSQVETFPASKEVRQVNLIVHDVTPSVAGEFFVSSPAGLQANINIPVSRIRDRFNIKISNDGIAYLNDTIHKLSVSSAMLNLEATDSSTTAYPPYLLLIRKSKVNSFFNTLSVPDGKSSMLASYSSSSTTKYYSFSLKTYLANVLKDKSIVGDDPMVLIPVMITYDTSDNITGVKYDSKLHAVAFKGSTNTSPLKLDLVFSGF